MSNPIVTEASAIVNDPNASLPDKVAAAAKLWALVEECQTVLESFKIIARAHAVSTGESKVTINGNGMSQCQVIVPTPSLKLRDGLKIDDEKAALGELFDTIFEVKLALRNASPLFLGTFPQHVQNHVAKRTTIINNPPRVSFKVLSNVDEVK